MQLARTGVTVDDHRRDDVRDAVLSVLERDRLGLVEVEGAAKGVNGDRVDLVNRDVVLAADQLRAKGRRVR